MFGASRDNLPQEGKNWQLAFSYRGLDSHEHYSGTQYQAQRESGGTNVINTQQLYDLSGTYFFNPRWSAFMSVPVVNASWSLPTPPTLNSPGPRQEQNASGIGDVIVGGRFWTLSPDRHPHGNFSVGLGVKAPTGDYKVEDRYPNINGTNNTDKVVDISIQPGDGGWGYLFDLQGYHAWKRASFYGTGSYLVNPRDTNGAASVVVGLVGNSPAFGTRVENTVPDQYLLRVGTMFPVSDTGLGLGVGFRMEGLPRYDLIGDSHGFRRPGYETFIEPGIVYTWNQSTFSLYVPYGIVQNRLPDPYTGNAGDATFPRYIVLAGWSYNFKPQGAASKQPALPPSQPTVPGTPPGSN